MNIIKEENQKQYLLKTEEIEIENITNLNNKISKKILEIISKKPMYPKEMAKVIGVHEQNIYYYIKKLEKSKIIKVQRQENINGTLANFYEVAADSFYFKFNNFKETSKIAQKESEYLKPFIKDS